MDSSRCHALRVYLVSTLCIADQLNILQSIAAIARAIHHNHNPPLKKGHVSLPNSRDACRLKMANVNGSSTEAAMAASLAEERVEELTQLEVDIEGESELGSKGVGDFDQNGKTERISNSEEHTAGSSLSGQSQRQRKEGGGGEAEGEAGGWKREGGVVGEGEGEGEGDLGLVISGNGGRDSESVGGEGACGESEGGDSGQLRIILGDVRKLDCSVHVSEGGRAAREEDIVSGQHTTQSTHKEKDKEEEEEEEEEEEGTLDKERQRQRRLRRREAGEREREKEPEEEDEEILFIEHWDDALAQAGESGQAIGDRDSDEPSSRGRNPLKLIGCVGRKFGRKRREGRVRERARRGPEDLPPHHGIEHKKLESPQSRSWSKYLMTFGMGAGTFEVPFSF